MKNLFVSAAIASAALISCSTVSSVLQNTLPYNASFVITQGSPAGTQLSAVGGRSGINQITGVSSNVKDIRATNATLSMLSGNQGMGIFRSVNVYVSSGSDEILVASRDNIPDNIGNTLTLDVNNSRALDGVMKSGNAVSQRIVYVLKSAPTSDLTVRSSVSFNSVPAN